MSDLTIGDLYRIRIGWNGQVMETTGTLESIGLWVAMLLSRFPIRASDDVRVNYFSRWTADGQM